MNCPRGALRVYAGFAERDVAEAVGAAHRGCRGIQSGQHRKPSSGVELGDTEFLPLAQHGVLRCVVRGLGDLSPEPCVDAIGGGVDLIIVFYQADLAVSAHRLLLFYLTIGACPPRNKTRESMC
jgi:hypothetical protein